MEYQYIVNPKTGRKCNIGSRTGKKIIKNYVNQTGGDKYSIKRENIVGCIQQMKSLWNAGWELDAMKAQYDCLENDLAWIVRNSYLAADREYLHYETISKIINLFNACLQLPDSRYCDKLNDLLNQF